jgi:Ca2+-binding RTX toxin-like protein
MVKFRGKDLPVDNRNLSELDNYRPFKPKGHSIDIEAKYKENIGILFITVTQDDAVKYRIARIEVAKKDVNKLFKGDNWEPKLFKGKDYIDGSSAGDRLYGFHGHDSVEGKGGNDFLYGGGRKDYLIGDEDNDVLYGGSGNDKLYGGDGVDKLFGGGRDDFLDAGTGTVNEVTGGSGNDTFAFSAPVIDGANYTQINDFEKGKDKIQLSETVFQGLASGALNSSNFVLASEYSGQSNVIIYDEASGNIHYGKEGAIDYLATPIFGRIANGVILSNTDFVIGA